MMESQITLLLSLLIILVTVAAFKVIRSKSGLPPSPWGLPIIGHLHLLGKLPHQSLHKLALQHGGLIFLKLGTVRTVIVSTSDAAKEILQNNDIAFASRPATASGEHFGYKGAGLVWASYGQHWRNMRKLCSLELLSSKRVELSQPVRKYEVSLLVNELWNHSKERLPVDLTNKLADLTFNIIMRMVMNKSCSGASTDAEKEEIAHFRKMVTEAFTIGGISIAEFLPWLGWMDNQIAKMKVIKQSLDEFLEKQVVEHRKQLLLGGHPPRDFIDVMMSLKEDSLSDDSIKALSLDMIAAGTDTAAVTVEWALAELVRRPELLLRAQQELKDVVGENRTMDEGDLPKLSYLTAIVKETLRLHPPGPLLIPHESTQSCKVQGSYFIPAGTRAIVNVYAIARDSAHWKQPLTFDPERFMDSSNAIDVKGQGFEFLPFGAGRRSCPGILMGMTTVQMILGSLLHAFEWSLPDRLVPEELDMSEHFGLTVPRAKPLKLIPAARLKSEAYIT